MSILSWYRKHRSPKFHRGGVITNPSWTPDRNCYPIRLSEGKRITDPDEAEALGLTADAQRLRESAGGCVCCGTTDNLMWRKGDHELAVTTICRPCKFGACEECK